MNSSSLSRLSILQRHLPPPASLLHNLVAPSRLYVASSRESQGDRHAGDGSIRVSPEVSEALSAGRPVVALESTVISHGMPYPKNFEVAAQMQAVVRENGGVPAVIAIVDGVPQIGLSMEELEKFAKLGTGPIKTARRDIAHVVASGENGATTVSATMFFASKVGISVFATGGIGGVHRQGESTMDISSDLTELGRTPVAVVAAGAKSILDIPRTLEYLETLGVCVAAYGTDEFPAFFTQTSGCKVPCRVDSPEDCARLVDANRKLKLGSGTLIAVPIQNEHAASGSLIEDAIQKAIKEARDKNFTGSAETPYVLTRVIELTRGASLASNIALLMNNAFVGTKIAVALAHLGQE